MAVSSCASVSSSNVLYAPHASVSINSLGVIDNLQIAATGLVPGRTYQLVELGDGRPQVLLRFTAGIGGVSIAQTLGPLKRVARDGEKPSGRFLEVRFDSEPEGVPVLVQSALK